MSSSNNQAPILAQAPANNTMQVDINLESPFIKIVQECIVKTFKSHKKFIEKEVSTIVNKITQLKKAGSSKGGSEYVIETLDALISKLHQLKTKYKKMLEVEDYLIEVMGKRLRHLHKVVESAGNAEVMRDYFSKRLNRIIIDYMLRENYFESAKIFVEETGLKDFVDIEVFEETSKIMDRLKNRECKDALEWCKTHQTKLQKTNSQLEFKLRVQEYVEMIKQNQLVEAIDYAKKQLTKFDDDPESLAVLSKILGFIAFNKERRPQNFNYKYFADEKRWEEIRDIFLKESFQLYSQPENSLISLTLQVGLPVLKTEFCMNEPTFNEQCPTCSNSMRKLGQKLPFSHHTQTCIQCKVTGEIMNDQNQPIFLPTGFVVSQRALEKLSDKNDSAKFQCPFTSQTINRSDVRKVYFS